MTKGNLAVVAFAAALVAALVVSYRAFDRGGDRVDASSAELAASTSVTSSTTVTRSTASATTEADRGFLYGRVTTIAGDTYEGRLRWGGTQEAFWGDYFNGEKGKNAWIALVPPDRVPKEHHAIGFFGFELVNHDSPLDLRRLFMARFGDIARIEAHGREVRVTLKSGTAFELGRFEASDFDDGVRVWDVARGVVDLDSLKISVIELFPTAPLADVPQRLHGTVRTRQGQFAGYVQWNREDGIGSDALGGRTADGKSSLRFDTMRSIERRSHDSALVTLLDGRELELSATSGSGDGNRGLYVDDGRYGRVLISWDAFERIDFTPGGSGPAYGDFRPGRPLTGSVTTRDGRRLVGRIVYDLDESETTETLDAPSHGVDYTIPLGLVASIVRPSTVTLRSGEALQLEARGDLGARNAGLLVFVEGGQHPEYVSWSEVARIDFQEVPPHD